MLVKRLPEEAMQMTAIRIFTILLLALGSMLALVIWIEEPAQIVLTLGIVWGAVVIALRDLIQNFMGSLSLLFTGVYRIGDHIRIRNVYGLVMDIGTFRTTLMELDRDAGDRPTGEIITIPNGILFRELVTNTSRHLSVLTDEIRVTVPYTSDLKQVQERLIAITRAHTRNIEDKASEELGNLSAKKYMPYLETKPEINMQLSDWSVLVILKYVTTSKDRSAIKTAIAGELSKFIAELNDKGGSQKS
jgi:small-conductance mechanosensitive channel